MVHVPDRIEMLLWISLTFCNKSWQKIIYWKILACLRNFLKFQFQNSEIKILISEFQIFKSQSLLSEVSQRKRCQCNVVYMLKQTLNYKSFKLLRVMKVTWEFLSNVLRVMTSISRTQYPFNCPWGQREQHKERFLHAVYLNGTPTNFNCEYIKDLLKGIVVCSDNHNPGKLVLLGIWL